MPIILSKKAGGGGGAPSGAAGGDLSGTYPNPTVNLSAVGLDPVTSILGTPDTAFEFESASLAGLTALGAPTAENADTTVPNNYYVQQDPSAYAWVGRYVAPPATPWTVVAKITGGTAIDDFNAAGLFVGVSPPGNMDIIYHGKAATNITIDRVTPSAFGSNLASGLWSDSQPPCYLAIRANSATDVDYIVSQNGLVWVKRIDSRNPAITLGAVGIAIKSENGSFGMAAAFDYLRIWNSAKAFPGAAA